MQTTYLNRTYLSALYQLMGMYPENSPGKLDFEKYDICYEKYLTRANMGKAKGNK